MSSRVRAAAAGLLLLTACPPYTQDQSYPPGLRVVPISEGYVGLENPYRPDDPAVLEEGRRLYHEAWQGLSCAACHGNEGRGLGPMWTYIEPRPPRFSDDALLFAFREYPGHVFGWISDGLVRSPMPGFKVVMTEEERWKVITYAWHLGLELQRDPPVDRPGERD